MSFEHPTIRHPVEVLAELAKKAKSAQQGLYPGNEDPVGFWLTPPELMADLEIRHGPFETDACPYPRPAGYDGTVSPWKGKTYVNPPFEGKRPGFTAWIKKALKEAFAGNQSVLIFPMDGWVSIALDHGATFEPVGQHDWIDARTGKRKQASRKSVLILFKEGVQRCPPNPRIGKPEGCPLCNLEAKR